MVVLIRIRWAGGKRPCARGSDSGGANRTHDRDNAGLFRRATIAGHRQLYANFGGVSSSGSFKRRVSELLKHRNYDEIQESHLFRPGDPRFDVLVWHAPRPGQRQHRCPADQSGRARHEQRDLRRERRNDRG